MQVKALLSMGILVGIGSVSTLATWTGTATATSDISTGTVSLGVGKTDTEAGSGTYPIPINSANWYPEMSQAAIVTVKNTGSVAAAYSISGNVVEAGEGKLGSALEVTVSTGSVSGTSPSATCTGPALLIKPALGDFPSHTRPTSLDPGKSESLCVQYSLPASAANALQGNSTTVKLTFTATVGS
jgi:hypothetical protein